MIAPMIRIAMMIHVTTTDSAMPIPPKTGIVKTVSHSSSAINFEARSPKKPSPFYIVKYTDYEENAQYRGISDVPPSESVCSLPLLYSDCKPLNIKILEINSPNFQKNPQTKNDLWIILRFIMTIPLLPLFWHLYGIS